MEQTAPAQDDEASDYVRAVLGETEDVWEDVFPAATGQPYREPALVLYNGVYPTACGTGSSATGPFYCPSDQRVYIDLSFFNQLARMGGRGDFAPAYVIAHEVGHHIQNLTGVLGQAASQRGDPQTGVAVELQADCYAGVWAYHADQERDVLEESDVQEGIDAAAAVGDDAIRGGAVAPDALSHGTAASASSGSSAASAAATCRPATRSGRPLQRASGARGEVAPLPAGHSPLPLPRQRRKGCEAEARRAVAA